MSERVKTYALQVMSKNSHSRQSFVQMPWNDNGKLQQKFKIAIQKT